MLAGPPVKGNEQTLKWGKLFLLFEFALRDLLSYTQLASVSLWGCPVFPLLLRLPKHQSSGIGVVFKGLAYPVSSHLGSLNVVLLMAVY